MKERTMFAQEFLKHRKKVASPTPTSDSSAIKICSFVPYSPDNKIVEYGPGTGAITKYLINKLGNESQLVLIEEKANEKINQKKKLETIRKIAPKIIKILKKNNVKKASIFGSYARGEQKKNSDIDILIEPPEGIGYGFIKIEFELEDELGRKVDLLSYKAIHPLLKKRILKEEVRLIW